MTIMANPSADVTPVETVSVTIDGITIDVPKGTLIIRAAETLGIAVPRFCDHPLLEPVAACRMCLVEVEGQGKPQPSCAITCNDGMVVRTQNSSQMAQEAQAGVMEFLLINHPLDCPVCDKGGECPLQNQAMTAGAADTRFDGTKRTFEKPINVSAQVLLDRERCVSCARCTRFADEIAGDSFIDLLDRGAQQQVGTSDDDAFDSYFSGNTIQICPVGALTSANYRFRARPFDLVSTPTVCEHCSSGCNLRTDHRRHSVMRRLAWDNPQVNEEWSCDKGRFAFAHTQIDRITHPMVRGADGELQVASWPHALAVAAAGLRKAAGSVGVLTGGRLTTEDAYAYSRFARGVLGTDDIDFRNRVATDEEAAFLAHSVVGADGVTYASVERAPFVLLVSFEPEDESPIVFLRLRKSARVGRTKVATIAPFASAGSQKLNATLVAAAPGTEATAVTQLPADIKEALAQPGAVILVGERAAASAGTLSAVSELAASTGASLAWIPRRAGERGALEAGALAGLLPGGRDITDATAREFVAAVWGSASLPSHKGRNGEQILRAAAAGELAALVVAGVDPNDSSTPALFEQVLAADTFIVSLETRHSAVTQAADVVFPVAVVTEKQGSFVNWEGRLQSFGAVSHTTTILSDARVLADIADAMGVSAFPTTVTAIRREMQTLRTVRDVNAHSTAAPSSAAAASVDGVRLATWHELLDAGTLQGGEPFLAATARPVVARMSADTAAAAGIADGDMVAISCNGASIELPAAITSGMVSNTVWVPSNAVECNPNVTLQAHAGAVVNITRAGGR